MGTGPGARPSPRQRLPAPPPPGPSRAPSSDRRERHAGGSGGAAPGPRLVLGTPNTVTNLHVAAPSGPEAAECLVCSELALLVLFSPCQHRTVCEGECGGEGGAGERGPRRPARPPARPRAPPAECARRMKKCIRCQVVIGKKLRPGGWGAGPGPTSARPPRPS